MPEWQGGNDSAGSLRRRASPLAGRPTTTDQRRPWRFPSPAEVPLTLDPARVMIAGMNMGTEAEDGILKELRPPHTPSGKIAEDSGPILDWIEASGGDHPSRRAFRPRCLDPPYFPGILFNKRSLPEGTFERTARGAMRLGQVVHLLKDTGAVPDMIGLTITDHLPRDMLRLRTRPPISPSCHHAVITSASGLRQAFEFPGAATCATPGRARMSSTTGGSTRRSERLARASLTLG